VRPAERSSIRSGAVTSRSCCAATRDMKRALAATGVIRERFPQYPAAHRAQAAEPLNAKLRQIKATLAGWAPAITEQGRYLRLVLAPVRL
jgi:hypothetical protein